MKSERSVITIVTALIKKILDDGPSDTQRGDFEVEASIQTDVGCYRDHNEDRILYVKPADSVLLENKGVLALVADGMGGHQAGEVASQMAVDIIRRCYYQSEDAPVVALQKAFVEANQMIYQAAGQELNLQGMGTTTTALVLRKGEVFFAHVGDSRLYRLHQGELYLLTEDHTLVSEMHKSGLISADEARYHPQKNIITRALGTHPKVEVDISPELPAIQINDRFVLCSDGLYDLVDAEEIKQIVQADTPYIACEQLILLAKERGGHDNISVGVLAVYPPERVGRNVPETREARVQTS